MTEGQFYDMFEKRLASGASITEFGSRTQWLRLNYTLEAYYLAEFCPLVNIRLIFKHIRMVVDGAVAPRKDVIRADIETLDKIRAIAANYKIPRQKIIKNNIHDRIRNDINAWQQMINEVLNSTEKIRGSLLREALMFANDETKVLIKKHDYEIKNPNKLPPEELEAYQKASKKQKGRKSATTDVRKQVAQEHKEKIHQLYIERHGKDTDKIPIGEFRMLESIISRETAMKRREQERAHAAMIQQLKNEAEMIASHVVRLHLNNQQKAYLQKCFGVARFCYNWAYDQWIAARERGEKVFASQLQEQFHAINKEQYPWTYEVTHYAKSTGFDAFDRAQYAFFKGMGFPQRKRHGLGFGSLHYIVTGDRKDPVLLDYNPNGPHADSSKTSRKRQYLFVPGLGYVKMMEKLRFRGLVSSVTICYRPDGHYYASLNVHLSVGEWERTHRGNGIKIDTPIGIDLGIKDFAILSNGLCIDSRDVNESLYQQKRQLQKEIYKYKELHPQYTTNRLRALQWQLCKVRSHMARQREDYLHKVTSALAYTFKNICIENLNVADMIKDGRVRPGDVLEASFYRFRELMEEKCAAAGHRLHVADKFFPSTRACSSCGCIQDALPLKQRTFHCPDCGLTIDRDLNAAINLSKLIGLDEPNLRSVDKSVVAAVLQASGITTHQTAEEKQAGLQT